MLRQAEKLATQLDMPTLASQPVLLAHSPFAEIAAAHLTDNANTDVLAVASSASAARALAAHYGVPPDRTVTLESVLLFSFASPLFFP